MTDLAWGVPAAARRGARGGGSGVRRGRGQRTAPLGGNYRGGSGGVFAACAGHRGPPRRQSWWPRHHSIEHCANIARTSREHRASTARGAPRLLCRRPAL